MATLMQQSFRRKPVTAMTEETGADHGGGELARSIGLFQLSMIGVGATIGTGIFFVMSQAVPVAGPAVIWSFVIAGVVAGLTAVCYAELASAVPVSGSSYSYAYATLGEVVAMGGGRLPAAGVRGVLGGGGGGLVGVPQRSCWTTCSGCRIPEAAVPVARGRRRDQPAGGGAGRAVRAAAHPRRERVGHASTRSWC